MLNALVLLLWTAVDLFLVFTGKWIVHTISWGRWRSERSDSREGRLYGPAGALSFQRDGHRVLTSSGLLFLGLAFYTFLGAIAAVVVTLA